jgi:hypothetical protein
VHHITTDDASVLSAKILGRGVWVSLHALNGRAVLVKRRQPPEESAAGHIQVPKNMNRKAVKHEQDIEEGHVDGEFDKVFQKGQC